MHAYGTDITRRMYFTQYSIADPDLVSFCVAVPVGSQGECVEFLSAAPALCLYHHGAYEELPTVAQHLLSYAQNHGLTPAGTLRHTYLEGPPQHKDPGKFITQVALEVAGDG